MSNDCELRDATACNQPCVAIVIVSYEGCQDTIECIASVTRLTGCSYEIVLVDQNSLDETVEAVGAEYPFVKILRNPINDGASGGNNLGLREALKGSAEYFLLLNNDTVVAPDMLIKLVSCMEKNKQIGVIGPASFFYSQPNVVCWAGSKIDWRGRDVGNVIETSIERYGTEIRDTDLVAGGAFLIRKAVVEQVGFMDDRFFIYFDDTDYFARARSAGWELKWLPTARIFHKISQTSVRTGQHFGVYHWQRNRLLYLWKHGRPRLISCAWCLLGGVKAVFVQIMHRRQKMAIAYFRAIRDSVSGRWGGAYFRYKYWPK